MGELSLIGTSLTEKVKGLAGLWKQERQKPPSMTATSDCPFGECDGSGIVLLNKDGKIVAKHCRCAEKRRVDRQIAFANIPPEFEALTVKSFDTEIYGDEASRRTARGIKKLAIEYVQKFDSVQQQGKGLYLYGEPPGSGKTRLAVSIGNACAKKWPVSVKFITTVALLDEIKASWNKYDEEQPSQSKIIAGIKGVGLLILDDIGTERPSSWVNETFYNILNDRMTAKRITFFTSNCKVEELSYGPRIISRIERMAMPVKFPDESVRRTLAGQENDELMTLLMGE